MTTTATHTATARGRLDALEAAIPTMIARRQLSLIDFHLTSDHSHVQSLANTLAQQERDTPITAPNHHHISLQAKKATLHAELAWRAARTWAATYRDQPNETDFLLYAAATLSAEAIRHMRLCLDSIDEAHA